MCETQTGTPYYASPEVWLDEPYDSRSDIWSIGCVLYEFINLKPPFRARDMEGLYKKVTRGYFSRINKNYSDDLMVLLKKLIKVNPKERLTTGEILELALIKKHHKKNKQVEVDEKSVLLKTIKLTKNINYLTERLPKPNYSPLRLKSISQNIKGSLSQRYKSKSPYDLHLSLPPIKSQPKIVIKGIKDKSKLEKNRIRNKSKDYISKDYISKDYIAKKLQVPKSERVSPRKKLRS